MSSSTLSASASQLTLKLKPSLLPCYVPSLSTRNKTSRLRFSSTTALLLNNHVFSFSRETQPLFLYTRNSGFCANAESESSDGFDEAERLGRGDSTLLERFRYLTRQVPKPPSRWPWFLVVPLLIYWWRELLLELSNWQKLAMGIIGFICDLSALGLALVFNFIGDPITFLFGCIETALLIIRSYYSGIVAYAPVGELCVLIMLASAVIAIAEATVRDSVHGQPYVISGLIGYAAVKGYISGPLFWTLLLGLYGFSKIFKKRDEVSSVMPVAALLAAIGEPWVRIVVVSSYLALAISQHSKQLSKGNVRVETSRRERKLPLPLLATALAIGVHLAAKWVGNRHLTWIA